LLVIVLGIFSISLREPSRTSTDARVLGEQILAASNNGNSNAGQDAKKFVVTGTVAGLYPGAQRPLILTVSNPNNFDIKITSLTVNVGNAAPGCNAANLQVSEFSGSVIVPKDGTTTTTLQATMARGAGDSCQGATFPLSYGGTAVKP
jgi:hypothetical protein